MLVIVLHFTSAFMPQRFAGETRCYLTYTPDDAQALGSLPQHIQPGELLVNEGSAMLAFGRPTNTAPASSSLECCPCQTDRNKSSRLTR
jgi:hypothetical protein